MAFVRHDAPPVHVVTGLGLAPGSRILGCAHLEATNTWLMAVWAGLATHGPGGARLRPWTEIERVTLDRDTALMTVYPVDQDQPAERFSLGPKDKRLIQVINERVKASVLAVEYVPVDGGPIRVALRRPAQGDPFVQVITPKRAAAAAGAVQAEIAVAADRLREAVGLPA
ncbi:MAG: hypothetical protein LBR19_00315 [Bifidobacteriaceae bacterium]|jgi:hypothetical protein|nr:hypothetical protein [Bifidobacteriaceae bacterium]